jgi:hypothetical protein
MNWEAIGAIGDFVGGLAVVFTLIYIAFQVRQNSKQMDQNSRALAASTHYAAGEGFNKWFALIAQDEALANLWRQGLAGETLNPADRLRFRSMATMLFTTLENNFHQFQLGSHSRNTLQIGKRGWVSLLSSPGGSYWWKKQGRQSFTPEFVEAIETIVAVEDPEESGK